MYYLRKIEEDADRAIYKATDCSRFYRQHFKGLEGKVQGVKLYTCKTIKKILELRKSTFDYSGEWFDVYDENGKVELSEDESK